MIKRFALVFALLLFLSCIFYAHPIYATTDKQKAVGQMIADFAADVSVNHKNDFGYSYIIGSEGKILTSVRDNRAKANKLGIRYSGYVYFTQARHAATAKAADLKNQGRHDNKFIVYCASYADFLVYHAIGGMNYKLDKLGTETIEKYIDTQPKIELQPGDVISTHQEVIQTLREGYDQHVTFGHTFVFIKYGEDYPNNPWDMYVAQSPGKEEPKGVYNSVGLDRVNLKTLATADLTQRFTYSVERISQETAEAVNLNLANSSLDLYDRLDHNSPTINNLVAQTDGRIEISATDEKVYLYKVSDYGTHNGVLQPVTEPSNYGIVGYKVTEDENMPTDGWTSVAKTASLNITAPAASKNGTYYVWVTDVGGNVACKQIEVKVADSSGGGGRKQ